MFFLILIIPRNDSYRPAYTPLDIENTTWLNGKLRDYQVEGVNSLIYNWIHNSNIILADEAGLGKTVQSVAFMGWLKNVQNLHGPFLIVCPQSKMAHWEEEINKWLPAANAIIYSGNLYFLFFFCMLFNFF